MLFRLSCNKHPNLIDGARETQVFFSDADPGSPCPLCEAERQRDNTHGTLAEDRRKLKDQRDDLVRSRDALTYKIAELTADLNRVTGQRDCVVQERNAMRIAVRQECETSQAQTHQAVKQRDEARKELAELRRHLDRDDASVSTRFSAMIAERNDALRQLGETRHACNGLLKDRDSLVETRDDLQKRLGLCAHAIGNLQGGREDLIRQCNTLREVCNQWQESSKLFVKERDEARNALKLVTARCDMIIKERDEKEAECNRLQHRLNEQVNLPMAHRIAELLKERDALRSGCNFQGSLLVERDQLLKERNELRCAKDNLHQNFQGVINERDVALSQRDRCQEAKLSLYHERNQLLAEKGTSQRDFQKVMDLRIITETIKADAALLKERETVITLRETVDTAKSLAEHFKVKSNAALVRLNELTKERDALYARLRAVHDAVDPSRCVDGANAVFVSDSPFTKETHGS